MEDARNLQQIPAKPVARPASVPLQVTSNANVCTTTVPLPLTNAHAQPSMQAQNPFENSQNFLVNNSLPIYVPRLSSQAIAINVVPSTAQGHSRFQVMSAYDNNGDNILVLLKKYRVN